MRLSHRERLREAKRIKSAPINMEMRELLLLMLDPQREQGDRRMNPTQEEVIFAQNRYSLYMGVAGCAKTSTICAKGLFRSILEPGAKGLIGRADYNDLADTTMLRVQEMIDALPKGTLLDRDKSPPAKWYISSVPMKRRDGHWDDRPAQITFMGMKDKLSSYEFNWAALDEVDEIDEKQVLEVNTRMRAKGAHFDADNPNYYTIDMACNPPDVTHWLYPATQGVYHNGDKYDREKWIHLYRPAPKENIRNLPTSYYSDMEKTLPEDMLMRLVRGEWGAVFPGQPVYRQFKYAIHAKDTIAWPGPKATLYRFWDFGYNHPACLWAVCDTLGRIYILREEQGHHVEATAFGKRIKYLTNKHYLGAERIVDIGDPAVAQKRDTGSTLATLAREGIIMHYQRLGIDASVRHLRKKFETLVEGEPAIQIDKRCSVLLNALKGGYRLKDDGVTPHKDGFYDHLADALRYGISGVDGADGNMMMYVPETVEYQRSLDQGFEK